MRLAWACAGGNMQLIIDSATTETLHESLKDNEPDENDVAGKFAYPNHKFVKFFVQFFRIFRGFA